MKKKYESYTKKNINLNDHNIYESLKNQKCLAKKCLVKKKEKLQIFDINLRPKH